MWLIIEIRLPRFINVWSNFVLANLSGLKQSHTLLAFGKENENSLYEDQFDNEVK